MKITVTQDDIDNGIRRSCRDCPIALALRRRFPSADIHVDGYGIAIEDGRAFVPLLARRFADDFDNGRPVCPFELEIDPWLVE